MNINKVLIVCTNLVILATNIIIAKNVHAKNDINNNHFIIYKTY